MEEDDGLLAGPGDGEGKNWVYVSSFISKEKYSKMHFIIYQISTPKNVSYEISYNLRYDNSNYL